MDIEQIITEDRIEMPAISGGPIPIKDDGTLDLRNLRFTLDSSLTNTIIHIEYLPDEDRYGFRIYKVRE